MKPRWILVLLVGAALVGLFFVPDLPEWVAWSYAGFSLASLVAYAWDKAKARQGSWRTRESTLHALALLGGWPGALIGQRFFHHKTRKVSFQIVFWLTVAGHAFGWWYYFVRP